MFYVKEQRLNGGIVKIEITDENVFTRCPDCKRELSVDLVELFSDSDGDLFSTRVVCSACTKKKSTSRRKFMDGMKISTEALALLADSLCGAGYGELVEMIYLTNSKLMNCTNLRRGNINRLPKPCPGL